MSKNTLKTTTNSSKSRKTIAKSNSRTSVKSAEQKVQSISTEEQMKTLKEDFMNIHKELSKWIPHLFRLLKKTRTSAGEKKRISAMKKVTMYLHKTIGKQSAFIFQDLQLLARVWKNENRSMNKQEERLRSVIAEWKDTSAVFSDMLLILKTFSMQR